MIEKTIELPRGVSQWLKDDLEYSLDKIFPKLFCRVDIEENIFRITIPNIYPRIEFLLLEKKTVWPGFRDISKVGSVFMYKATLPIIDLRYEIMYNSTTDSASSVRKFILIDQSFKKRDPIIYPDRNLWYKTGLICKLGRV